MLELTFYAKNETIALKSFLKNQAGDAAAPNQYKFPDLGELVDLRA